jgi:hypothetical protein
MTQAQLNRAVARATGESVQTVERHGFTCVFRRARSGRAKRSKRRRPKALSPPRSRDDGTVPVAQAV